MHACRSTLEDPTLAAHRLPAPLAPATLNAQSAGVGEIDLTWSDVSNESSYKIERSITGIDGWTQIGATIADLTSYNDISDLAPASTYYYRVRASNSTGDSPYSDVANATTALPSLPAAPSELHAISGGTHRINLTWTDNADNETAFRIERSPDGSTNWTPIATAPRNATSFADTLNLSFGTQYFYQVVATNLGGDSDLSNVANATTDTPTLPDAPDTLQATPISASRIDLTWVDRSGNEDGFILERSPDGVGDWATIVTLPANSTSFSDTGLAELTDYYYRVRATNEAGDSLNSDVTSAKTLAKPVIPAAPSALLATPVSASRINLTWQDNSNQETGFKIERSTDTVSWSQNFLAAADATTFSDVGLASATKYYYRVTAIGLAGPSQPSNVASATTLTLAPAAPTTLALSVLSSSSIKLTWKDNSTSETGFRIERSTDGVNWTSIATVAANTTTYTSTGLRRNTRYYFRVVAFNSAGNSPYSNTASATTSK